MIDKLISKLQHMKEPKPEAKMLELVLCGVNKAREHNQHMERTQVEEDLKLATDGVLALLEHYKQEDEQFEQMLQGTIKLLTRFIPSDNQKP